MTILGWIVLFAGLGVLVYVMHWIDGYKASRQPLYLPPGEKNPLYRGEDGYYSPTKGWIVDGIFYGIILALAVVFRDTEYFVLVLGIICAGIGGALYLRTKKDWERFERNLGEQKAILTKLKSDPEGDHVARPSLKGFGKTHVFVSGSFYDFHEKTDIPMGEGVLWDPIKKEQALAVINPRLVKLSQMPESEWFKVGRNLKV